MVRSMRFTAPTPETLNMRNSTLFPMPVPPASVLFHSAVSVRRQLADRRAMLARSPFMTRTGWACLAGLVCTTVCTIVTVWPG